MSFWFSKEIARQIPEGIRVKFSERNFEETFVRIQPGRIPGQTSRVTLKEKSR